MSHALVNVMWEQHTHCALDGSTGLRMRISLSVSIRMTWHISSREYATPTVTLSYIVTLISIYKYCFHVY
jgi:hypothetical protein